MRNTNIQENLTAKLHVDTMADGAPSRTARRRVDGNRLLITEGDIPRRGLRGTMNNPGGVMLCGLPGRDGVNIVLLLLCTYNQRKFPTNLQKRIHTTCGSSPPS